MDTVSAKMWAILVAHMDELDLAALCGNPADWAGVFVRKRLDRLDEGCVLELCGNPAARAGEAIKPKFGGCKPDVSQLDALCGNPSDWAGEIVTAFKGCSKRAHDKLVTGECIAALCGNPAEWAKKTVFGMGNQLTLTSACVVTACGNPAPWARTIVLRGRTLGLDIAQSNEALCRNAAE